MSGMMWQVEDDGMGTFNFKRFAVVNERSAMKVNTDGVLLGAAMTVKPSDRTLLDVGTGTGTIALMAAQRLCGEYIVSEGIPGQVRYEEEGVMNGLADGDEVWIDAIDIDGASAHEAGMNFMNSPWAGRMKSHHASLEEFASASDMKYDLIFSNPPYFEDSLPAPDERRCGARHTAGLSYRELLEFAAERLTEKGRFSIVLPAGQEAALTRYARMKGFHLFRIVRVRTVPRKAPGRIVAEFSRERCPQPEDFILTIQEEGKYTQEYLSLTHDFYLFA